MAVGTTKMAKQQAIIRKLPAVETLRSTSVICTDKGTLTQNKMTVTDTFLPGSSRSFPESPGDRNHAEQMLLKIAVLCNDSHVKENGQEIGDPTETALLHFSEKTNESPQNLRDRYKREQEFPFDSERKLMSTVYGIEGEKMMLTTGGPDVMFNRCSSILADVQEQPMTDEWLNEVKNANEAFSIDALRVLAYGYKKLPEDKVSISVEEEKDLVLVGLTAMIDPPREAVYGSIEEAKSAGIRTIMITGDHKTTAKAVGRDIGLMDENDIALTGQELDRPSDEELDQKLENISIYARVSPEKERSSFKLKDKTSLAEYFGQAGFSFKEAKIILSEM